MSFLLLRALLVIGTLKEVHCEPFHAINGAALRSLRNLAQRTFPLDAGPTCDKVMSTRSWPEPR